MHAPAAADQLLNFMKNKLDEVPGIPFQTRPVTIYRLPTWFHEINKDLCEPKIVSIGPYHHGKESLRSMEEHKWSTLRDFLAHNENVRFEIYLREMRFLETQVRECYSENVNLSSDDFVMMFLLDGCFILEFILKLIAGQMDSILFSSWAVDGIRSDLCLLENQMPFFVIHKLFEIQGRCYQNCQDICPLLELIYKLSPLSDMLFQFRPPQISCSRVHHLLHLYYMGVLPNNQPEREESLLTSKSDFCGHQIFSWFKIFSKSSDTDSLRAKPTDFDSQCSNHINIPCVTELRAAGVKFRRKRRPRDMFDISFENGTMEIPFLQIDNNVKNYLWNMVAFEQRQLFRSELILSSYLGLMDSLINTEKDVAILVRSGIIENYLQNDEQAASFFNQFGRIFLLDYSRHYFHRLYKDIKRYSESTWHKNRARLMYDYFSNPWSSISVAAATILLILTFLQTYYSAAT